MDLNKFIKTKRKFQTESVETYIKTLEDEILKLNNIIDRTNIDDHPLIEFDPIKGSSKFTDQELEKECVIFWEKNGFDFDLDHIRKYEKNLYSKEIKKAYDRMNQRQNYRKRKISRKDFKLNIK